MKKYSPILLITLVCNLNLPFNIHAYDAEAKDSKCPTDIPVYVFSWPISDACSDKPRGGSSKGIDTTFDTKAHAGWEALKKPGLSKFEKDRLAILAMAGGYRVDFDFLETVGFSENYQRDVPYHSWGTEYVYVVEDEPEFISLQHVMVMYFKEDNGTQSEPMVMKHWRQDWTYEDDEMLVYDFNNQWKSQKVAENDQKGRWSQAVFQVDDSPRYESMGSWYHNGSFSAWKSDRTTRPLPRREYSHRSDYDVLIGYNRHTINRFGWVQEEENWKKDLNDDGSSKQYLAKEEGIARYRTIVNLDFSPGDKYMQTTGPFWSEVRSIWHYIYEHNKNLKLYKKRDDQPLYMPLFEYAQHIMDTSEYDPAKARAFAKKTIESYIVKQ